MRLPWCSGTYTLTIEDLLAEYNDRCMPVICSGLDKQRETIDVHVPNAVYLPANELWG